MRAKLFPLLCRLVLLILIAVVADAADYFPETEAQGGWRKNTDPGFVRSHGLDPKRVEEFGRYALSVNSYEMTSALVIKDGWIVGEWYSSPEAQTEKIYLASVGKSFATICFGIAVNDSQEGRLDYVIDRHAKVYDPRWLPAGFPLSDPGKEDITFDHIFRHTSGLAPQSTGDGEGEPVEMGRYQWTDYVSWVVGHDPVWPQTAPLYFPPGSPEEYEHVVQNGAHSCAYSSVAYAHIGLVLAELYDMPAHRLLWTRLLKPLGFCGVGFKNPPDPPDIKWFSAGGIMVAPRDFARFAYFLLQDGRWKDEQILLPGWLRTFTTTPFYENLRSNSDGFFSQRYPADLFRLYGSGGNFAFVVPSLKLIVIKTGRIHNFFLKMHERDLLRRAFRMLPGFPDE